MDYENLKKAQDMLNSLGTQKRDDETLAILAEINGFDKMSEEELNKMSKQIEDL